MGVGYNEDGKVPWRLIGKGEGGEEEVGRKVRNSMINDTSNRHRRFASHPIFPRFGFDAYETRRESIQWNEDTFFRVKVFITEKKHR